MPTIELLTILFTIDMTYINVFKLINAIVYIYY